MTRRWASSQQDSQRRLWLTGLNILQADSKSEIDIQAAVKMPPMPGQSRSLLQFDGVNNDIADLNDFQETIETVETVAASPGPGDKPVLIKVEEAGEAREPPYSDHDYTFSYKFGGQGPPPVKVEVGSAWIEEDAPPMVSIMSILQQSVSVLCCPS